jgi:hypothetical protein
MLAQNYEALHADAEATSVMLVERELQYIRFDLSTVATISTFIASFLYTNIRDVKAAVEDKDGVVVQPGSTSAELGAGLLLCISFMLNLVSVVSAVMLQVRAHCRDSC